MRWQLPWWLNPWRECVALDGRISELCETARMDIATISQLEERLADQIDENLSLRGKLRAALAPQGNLHNATAAQVPEFVLVGIDRGNGQGKRLIAGRDLPGAALSMTDISDPPPRWVVAATLARPLFIDDADYAACLARMREIWMNWDREKPASRATIEPPARGMIEP